MLRTLVNAEITARDRADEARRRRQAKFPVTKSDKSASTTVTAK